MGAQRVEVKMKNIILGSDHGGYKLKQEMKKYLDELGYAYEDLGCNSEGAVDYPDYAQKVGKRVAEAKAMGILFCRTGIGMSIAANKVKGIRAALCWNEDISKASREHNNANILCLAADFLGLDTAKRIAKAWLETSFSNHERHARRISKIENG